MKNRNASRDYNTVRVELTEKYVKKFYGIDITQKYTPYVSKKTVFDGSSFDFGETPESLFPN